ncbi:hypothetical protein BZA77DRAFT_293042 [Pyronema omphalodes]|nr:hypothetical protein BZA77DRAFT_293042 [Pyronema omphalodes]
MVNLIWGSEITRLSDDVYDVCDKQHLYCGLAAKLAKPAKPVKPVKPTRVKPEKPEKPAKPEKPVKPEKPAKPVNGMSMVYVNTIPSHQPQPAANQPISHHPMGW